MKKEDFYAPDWQGRQKKYKLIIPCNKCVIEEIKPSKIKKK